MDRKQLPVGSGNDQAEEVLLDEVLRFIAWSGQVKAPEDRLAEGREKRKRLVSELAQYGSESSFGGSKIHTGDLSPGCMTCGQGTWSCMYVNRECTAHCFFCPQDRKPPAEGPPLAEDIPFEQLDGYLGYLTRMEFEGVGISGGEPLLAIEQILPMIEGIKERFGQQIYLWLYTNGDLAEPDRLEALADAGLDEIRFNIVARRYDLEPVILARRFIPKVTVEIPAIPEDYDRLVGILDKLATIPIDFLNIHQLVATRHNYGVLRKKKYTFLPPADFREPPVLESELTALSVMRYALTNDIPIPINYCSHVYKARYQGSARRIRAAILARRSYERVTDAGFLSRLEVDITDADHSGLISALEQNGVPSELWKHDLENERFLCHPSLIGRLRELGNRSSICYDEADILPQTILRQRGFMAEEIVTLGPGIRVLSGRKPAAKPTKLGENEIAYLGQLGDHKHGYSGEDFPRGAARLMPFEQLPYGLQVL